MLTTRSSAAVTLAAAIALGPAVPGSAVPTAATQDAAQDAAQDGAQDGSTPRWGAAQDQGLSREAMWPAPTAADWARPCLIRWERSIEDALAVSGATCKPLLICVNMDGEIASEHYAGIRYRDPEIAKLYEPYVCVIASVYRHTPRDYDEEGRRVECPRFGTVTCSEHIWIEPGLYEQFFEGQRVAPRHIMVELDASETYDVYYAYDTASVFQTIHAGVANRDVETLPLPDADRPSFERVASPHAADREAVEEAYAAGDRATRQALLDAARALVEEGAARGVEPPVDLLRQAVFGLDLGLAAHARATLAQVSSPKAVDVVNEALRASLSADEREALIGALDRMAAAPAGGRDAERARTLSVVHRGLAMRSDALDVESWRRAVDAAGAGAARPEWSALAAQVDYHAEASRSKPDDAAAHLALAESYLELAVDPSTVASLARDARSGSTFTRLLFEDVRRAATRAEELGATGWRVDATAALAAYYLGDAETAYARAEKAALALPAGEQGWSAMAVLGVFAQGRRDAIARAAGAGRDWPSRWMTDVHAAYQVIAAHPLGSAEHVVAHVDFLQSFGAAGEAERALTAGIERFPDAEVLHDRHRGRLLAERGADGLEPAYDVLLARGDVLLARGDVLLARGDASPALRWQAAFTSLVAAEFQRRAREPEKAFAAYDRGIERFRALGAAQPDLADNAAHYVALALAGKARLALERGDLDAALRDVLASFDAHPRAAASLDGLGITPVGTARMLRTRCGAAERADAVLELDAALERLRAIDPELLELPAFERGGLPSPGSARRPRGERAREGG